MSAERAFIESLKALARDPAARGLQDDCAVLDFMKRTSFIEMDSAALTAIGPAAAALAHAEGLPAHARSIELRLP